MRTAPNRHFFVEGNDDFHAILNLLKRYDISREETPDFPVFHSPKTTDAYGNGQGKPGVLNAIESGVKASVNGSVGFVLDADESVQFTWDAVAHRLGRVDVDVCVGIDKRGFVGQSDRYQARAGVWIWPDNDRCGTLEDFLEDLVDEGNLLLPYARNVADTAKSKGATFPSHKRSKAVLHTWLAWQEEPGRPYGTAITSRYLRDDSETAIAFVNWFRRLFALES